MSSELEQMFLRDGGAPAGGVLEGSDEEEEEVTAQAVLKELQEAWKNEKLSPELLLHKADFVEVMIEQVEQMEENLKSLTGVDLRKDLHKLELARIQYLLRSYLRTRLFKIETHCLHLLKSAGPGQLSPAEAKYLKEYATNLAQSLKTTLDKMPRAVGAFDADEMEIGPELESHVFARSKVELTESLVVRDESGAGDEEVVLREGSQHVVPYSTVRDLLREGKVELV